MHKQQSLLIDPPLFIVLAVRTAGYVAGSPRRAKAASRASNLQRTGICECLIRENAPSNSHESTVHMAFTSWINTFMTPMHEHGCEGHDRGHLVANHDTNGHDHDRNGHDSRPVHKIVTILTQCHVHMHSVCKILK